MKNNLLKIALSLGMLVAVSGMQVGTAMQSISSSEQVKQKNTMSNVPARVGLSLKKKQFANASDFKQKYTKKRKKKEQSVNN